MKPKYKVIKRKGTVYVTCNDDTESEVSPTPPCYDLAKSLERQTGRSIEASNAEELEEWCWSVFVENCGTGKTPIKYDDGFIGAYEAAQRWFIERGRLTPDECMRHDSPAPSFFSAEEELKCALRTSRDNACLLLKQREEARIEASRYRRLYYQFINKTPPAFPWENQNLES